MVASTARATVHGLGPVDAVRARRAALQFGLRRLRTPPRRGWSR
ncbi:hypothetical protein [Pseudonocardia thermophila]|nr:hypothetical protein [Pseudonocardia thermophila]